MHPGSPILESSNSPTEATSTDTSAPKAVSVARGYPVIGTIFDILRDGPAYLSRLARSHPGEIVAFRLGPVTCYLITAPDHVQHVLHDHWREFTKGGMWEAARPLIGNSLGITDGEVWFQQRRMLQPLFNATHLASLTDVMVSAIDQELDIVGSRGADQEIDMVTEMAVITQRVLIDTMFGPGLDRRDTEYLVEQILIAFRQLNYRLFLYFLPNGFPLPGNRAFRRAIAALDDAMLRFISLRRSVGGDRNDLLSRLLGSRDETTEKSMDERQIRDQLVGFFVAGNETTATAMTWLWYVLERNPEVERRLRAEVTDVLGGRKPTYADLARLKYTKMVFLETLRMYPPGWMFPRFTEKATQIGEYLIPAGSPMILSPFISHRDPKFWTNPDAFDPERFSEHAPSRPRYAYFPFGGGPRRCIGDAFAIMEGQLIISMMLQRFQPRLVPGARVVPSSLATLKPRFGLKMKLGRAP